MVGSPPAPDPPCDAGWSQLAPGDHLTVVKLAPDGSEVTRYPGDVIARGDPECWTVVQSTWVYRELDLDGLVFRPGDQFYEWFSPEQPFNAFAVHAPDGQLRGWYANVTDPARLDATATPPILSWRDRYVDLIGLPDGTFTLRDEDELAASGTEQSDPPLYERIMLARDELVHRFERRLPPFADGADLPG